MIGSNTGIGGCYLKEGTGLWIRVENVNNLTIIGGQVPKKDWIDNIGINDEIDIS